MRNPFSFESTSVKSPERISCGRYEHSKNYFLPENGTKYGGFFMFYRVRRIFLSIAEDSLECSSKDLLETDLLH